MILFVGFDLVNLIILLIVRFENLVLNMILLIGFYLVNLILSRFENLVVNMILLVGFSLVNLIILLTLVLRIWSSI